MAEKFNNKYRIPSARLKNYDYSSNGAYFITICTENRDHFFGEIINCKMELSNTGVIADIFWHDIPHHTKNVILGEFIVMPNHIHGILILNNLVETLHATSNPDIVQTLHATSNPNDIESLPVQTLHATSNSDIVQTLHATSLPPKNETMANISPKSNSIATIIRSYKSAVTKHANRLKLQNGWQTRFHDHIIRNELEYQQITDYIINNPAKWQEDKFFEKEN